MGRFEGRVAVDVDDAEVEAELRLRLANHLERALAQAAARRAVENDTPYG